MNTLYRDLEPTHFVLYFRDQSSSVESFWYVALSREEYRDLYEEAQKGMVYVTLTAVMPQERFIAGEAPSAVGYDATYKPVSENHTSPSVQALAYMEERSVCPLLEDYRRQVINTSSSNVS